MRRLPYLLLALGLALLPATDAPATLVSATVNSGPCGATPTATSVTANNLVLKTSAGSLCHLEVVNSTSTAGFILILNATSAPADGAVTPVACWVLAASDSFMLNYTQPMYLTTGITVVVSSAATCFTKTTGTVTAFIAGYAL